MAGLQEFHSFVGKFVNLWQSGREATLQVNSLAGKATVSLKVELGQALPLQPYHQHQREPGPSRLRRRQRRADTRKSADQADTAIKTAEEVVVATCDDDLDVGTAGREVTENVADQAATASNTAEEVVAATRDDELDVATAGKEVTENVTENESDDFRNEDSLNEGIANIPQLDGEPEEGLQENEGKEAFECRQCKLVFIPMSHMHGNPIYDYQ